MSKGDKRRPTSVKYEELKRRWDKVFKECTKVVRGCPDIDYGELIEKRTK